ncbi:MAG: hypothetical protein PF517_05845 [Salinivirgaceae bacterium]|jgi:hypothetical protein|nr:hypothetical protein [Salinivirgaceae bacterium]
MTELREHIGLLLLLLLAKPLVMIAQDIEQVAKSPWINANGGITMSHIGNFSTDSLFTQQPYSMFLSGNINNQLFGVVDLPISFSYTNDEVTKNLPQPFNRFSMAPSYKWVKTYMGYASMSFSPYSLSGHEFFGGGVELTPKSNFKFSAMYGQLNKAVSPDTLGSEPYFKRMGGGFKVDYGHEMFDVSFNVFKAKDYKNSISISNDDSLLIKPKDNIAGTGMVRLKLIDNLSLMVEYAMSAMNHDITRTDSLEGKSTFLLDSRGDVSVYDAFKTSVAQSSKIGKVGATYERVSPNYATLGAYYFNNDFENITADFSTSLIPKVNLSMNVGFQRDNLKEQKTNNSRRFIYSINGSFAASKKLSLNTSVTNVQTYVHIRDIYQEVSQTNPYQNLDTLSFTQINFTSFGNANYVLQSSSKIRQNLNVGFTYQQASEIQFDDTRFIGNQIYNGMLSYQNSLIPQKLNFSSTVNYNYNIMPQMEVKVFTVNMSVRKAFYEKFNTSIVTTLSNASNSTKVVNVRLSGGYILLERHNFNLGLTMVNNKGNKRNTTQYGGNFTYSYMFNCSLKRENKKFEFEGNF